MRDQLIEALGERRKMLLQQTRPQPAQQLLKHGKRLDFPRREPKPRKLIAPAACGRLVLVPRRILDPHDRRVEVLAHQLDDAEHRRLGAFQAQLEVLDRNGRLAPIEDVMQLIDPVELVQCRI